ncbi:ABC transporter permease [Cellulomonas hominis]
MSRPDVAAAPALPPSDAARLPATPDPQDDGDPREPLQRLARHALVTSLLRSLGTLVLTVVTVVGLWWGAILAFDLSSYVAKSPADVVEFLFLDDDAQANRQAVLDPLGTTLAHAASGFLWGLLVAIALAMLFVLFKPVEQTLMPVAMLLRSVPLIAMAPVIILIFRRGSGSVAVIGGIVVLFPALVNIVAGLRSAPAQLRDLVEVYGAGRWALMRKVSFPAALPSLFASVRISVPGAITGALLAEWLATGDGLGGTINRAAAQVQFSLLWAGVVVVTLTALVLYAVAQVVENVVLSRMGMLTARG